MRRLLIGFVLPTLLCTLPFLIAGVVLIGIGKRALSYFFEHIDILSGKGIMELIITGGGVSLFLVQMVLCWRSLRWSGTSFNENADRWLSNLAQAAEWFPMLGLIGTVAGILEAFKASGEGGGAIQPTVIAPAITATGSGLFMALINILPSWIVILGRDLILLLSGTQPQPPGEAS